MLTERVSEKPAYNDEKPAALGIIPPNPCVWTEVHTTEVAAPLNLGEFSDGASEL
jgi:hypothetical protein